MDTTAESAQQARKDTFNSYLAKLDRYGLGYYDPQDTQAYNAARSEFTTWFEWINNRLAKLEKRTVYRKRSATLR